TEKPGGVGGEKVSALQSALAVKRWLNGVATCFSRRIRPPLLPAATTRVPAASHTCPLTTGTAKLVKMRSSAALMKPASRNEPRPLPVSMRARSLPSTGGASSVTAESPPLKRAILRPLASAKVESLSKRTRPFCPQLGAGGGGNARAPGAPHSHALHRPS